MRSRLLPHVATVCALAVLAALLTAGLTHPLQNLNEGLYARVAQEMLASHAWVMPTLDGVPYLEKPPLLYWLTAASFAAFGPGEAAARAAPWLGTVLMVCAIAWFARRHLSRRVARRAGDGARLDFPPAATIYACMNAIRPAAVAGTFYPGDPAALQRAIEGFLAGTRARPQPRPRAVIAPHAGYIYSGPIAAEAYAAIAAWRGIARRVVVAGPAHRVYVSGVAVPSASAFATPLGVVALDAGALAKLRALPWVETNDRAHAQEHCIEVQLPFLQSVLGDFQLVPLVVGDASPDEMAATLEAVWDEPDALVVVSSDLSHYMPWAAARARDAQTARSILDLEATLIPEEACGAAPINGLLRVARKRGLSARALDVRNSGDTAGDRDRVVGYGSFEFVEERAANG